MKSWLKTAIAFSTAVAVVAGFVITKGWPDLGLLDVIMYVCISFFVPFAILCGLGELFEHAQEEPVDTAGIKDGDILYFYGDYNYGYSRVERVEVLDAANKELRSSYAFANTEGEIITKWFPVATEFVAPGIAAVSEEVKGTMMWNFLNDKCELMLTTWVYKTSDNISDDKIKVFWDDGTINFVDLKEGKFLWSDWKKSVG